MTKLVMIIPVGTKTVVLYKLHEVHLPFYLLVRCPLRYLQ
jgi:hypothetical protein